jgi:hypothetical protein
MYELDKINEERRRKRLPPLSGPQASNAAASALNRQDGEFDMNWFFTSAACIETPSRG